MVRRQRGDIVLDPRAQLAGQIPLVATSIAAAAAHVAEQEASSS
jgi:hypothetical protein